ncbi:hypothetical protein DMB66_04035 [Actinoplanes sp. ATCC 53533]|uniref:hypothetical protein n=1 Tax=Actinoplanes sp. ATCC 53533 TaxID=1288362 RepID=UPI000F7941BF|nr:hypothetical protein [Actinoplanes sp. ATCC 53533]RSM73201.1 hypothetical protein DMB66_04035 [Actinoplanes sp. ATCC 53533]
MLDTSHSAATTVAQWRAAAESADADAALAYLSPDIVLNADEGADVDARQVNLGEQITASIEKSTADGDDKIDWKVTDRNEMENELGRQVVRRARRARRLHLVRHRTDRHRDHRDPGPRGSARPRGTLD